jgi:DNA-binding beta-propeller fold protein YncE
VTTVAGSLRGYQDGPGVQALFHEPRGIALDASGTLYVADRGNNCIRKVSPAGTVTTLAGSRKYGYRNGPGLQARFAWPRGVAVDTAGNIYVADGHNRRIRRIVPGGIVETFAGPQD